jgi:hypothetical protein
MGGKVGERGREMMRVQLTAGEFDDLGEARGRRQLTAGLSAAPAVLPLHGNTRAASPE